jgi:hypothetical protein
MVPILRVVADVELRHLTTTAAIAEEGSELSARR